MLMTTEIDNILMDGSAYKVLTVWMFRGFRKDSHDYCKTESMGI